MITIYFAGSIRGGRDDAAVYRALIAHIATRAQVLTEHISDDLSVHGEEDLSDAQIYARDMDWLRSCEAVIAEVSTPSLGVGYEIGMAEAAGIPVLCLCDAAHSARLSAMISGNSNVRIKHYDGIKDAQTTIDAFIEALNANPLRTDDSS
jgi:nucleoside 2-deoxyribosyltransferase